MNQRESELVIYCPYCSSIQEVGKGRSCCPERTSLIVPRIVAEQARESFTSAIEEKHQASPEFRKWAEDTIKANGTLIESQAKQIAMLRDMAKNIVESSGENCGCKFCQQARSMISATQATADAWEAEIKAMAKLEGKIEVLREAYRRWNEHNNLSMTTIMENLLAELRNQAHPSVKLTQIYARQKEICPNCEQTMPEGCGGIFKRDGTACRLNAAQPAQPRKPCTCDGWCDGLCLEKEGKRK